MIRTSKAGFGTYGTVYNAKMNKKDSTEIAVKRNIIDSEISFSGSIKEMDLLNSLRGHPYIVKLISVSFGNPFVCPNSPIARREGSIYKEDYLHFIFEKADNNLHDVIYENEVHISYLKLAMIQILLAVEFIHAKKILHRDLKPSNLLWFVDDKGRTSVKICDFGLSKVHSKREPSSPRVVTCWYRAPEICSHDPDYSYLSDIWSLGCIFYEIVVKKALLCGARDDDKKILGKISDFPQDIDGWKAKINLDEENVKEFNKYSDEDGSYDNFISLLDLMLKIDPKERISASQALEHPFCKPYQNIIEWSRTNFPPNPKEEVPITILSCPERKWGVKIAFILFNKRDKLSWYQHRMIFQSIDIFDRYLVYCSKKDKRKIPSPHNGEFLTKREAEMKYLVCLYLSIKYFTTLNVPIPFTDLMKGISKSMIEAEEFEKKLMKDVLRFKVYRETVYECLDQIPISFDEYKIRDLVFFYGTLTSRKDVTPMELLNEMMNKTL